MRLLGVLLLLALTASAAAEDADFCIVSPGLRVTCGYRDLELCQLAAEAFGGECVVVGIRPRVRRPDADPLDATRLEQRCREGHRASCERLDLLLSR